MVMEYVYGTTSTGSPLLGVKKRSGFAPLSTAPERGGRERERQLALFYSSLQAVETRLFPSQKCKVAFLNYLHALLKAT